MDAKACRRAARRCTQGTSRGDAYAWRSWEVVAANMYCGVFEWPLTDGVGPRDTSPSVPARAGRVALQFECHVKGWPIRSAKILLQVPQSLYFNNFQGSSDRGRPVPPNTRQATATEKFPVTPADHVARSQSTACSSLVRPCATHVFQPNYLKT